MRAISVGRKVSNESVVGNNDDQVAAERRLLMKPSADGRKVSDEEDESSAMTVETSPQSTTTPQPKVTLPTAPIQTGTVIAPTAFSAATQPNQKIQIVRYSDGKIQVGGLKKGQKLVPMPDGKLQNLATPNAAVMATRPDEGVTVMTPTPKLLTTATAQVKSITVKFKFTAVGRG